MCGKQIYLEYFSLVSYDPGSCYLAPGLSTFAHIAKGQCKVLAAQLAGTFAGQLRRGFGAHRLHRL